MKLSDNRFGKEFRLRTKADFFYLRSNSKSKNSKSLKVVFKPTRSNLNYTRIGIAVSKKCGKAVIRNKIKRLIREFFRCSSYKYMAVDVLIIIHSRYMADSLKNNINWKDQIRSDLELCFADILSQKK